jgi:hypothetical protein
VAWLLPELDDGAEPELKPLELDPELELELEPVELEPEPDDVEPDDVEPDRVEPEPEDELEDEPEPAEVPVDPVEEEAVLCVDPGRASATMPAAATLAMVTVVVADRTLARPRSLSAVARRTRSRSASLMRLILRLRPRIRLYGTSRSAMRRTPRCGPGPKLPREHEGQLKPRHPLRPGRRPRAGGPPRYFRAAPVTTF